MNTYPPIVHKSDLSPSYTSSIDTACNEIHKACKGFGTNETKLNSIFGSKTNPTERYLISHRYPELHKKSLVDVLKSETSGNYKTLLEFLALPIPEAEALMIEKATAGAGTNEELLYTILCGRSNADMKILKKAYYKRYNQDLITKVDSEVSGDFQNLLLICLQAAEEAFDPDYHTKEKAVRDAEEFYNSGQGKLGTDETKLFKIVCLSPSKHLVAVDEAHKAKYDNTLLEGLEKELSGLVQKAAVFTLGMKLNPFETIATLMKSTCAKIGTDELGLSACMVRYQLFMKEVVVAHEKLFEKTLVDRIRSETSGSYGNLLCDLAE